MRHPAAAFRLSGLRKTPASVHTVFPPLPAGIRAEQAGISSFFSNTRRRAAHPQANAFLFSETNYNRQDAQDF
jgi:hypothetical protein